MIANILSLVLTLIINCCVGAFLFFGMIVSMNGFTGKQAENGIIAYIVVGIISILLTSILSFISCYFLQSKWQMNPFLSGVISVIVFSIINGIGLFIAIIVAMVIAESNRKGGF
jgi:hypothetical protein